MKKIKTIILLVLSLASTNLSFGQTLTKLSTDQYIFVEGPTWDGTDNIYFTDVNGNAIIKYSTSAKTFKTLVTNTKKANGLMYNTDNTLVVCEGDAGTLTSRDSNGTVVKTLAATYNNIRFNSPNDLCVDGKGGIYFSDPTWSTMYQTQNRLYYRNALGTVTAVVTDMLKPNGVIVSADGKKLFVNDSWSTTIRSYDVQSDGTLINKNTFATIKLPSATDNVSGADGMALDKSGNLYVACKLGILVYNSAGVLLKTISLPEIPTNCEFGGTSMNMLYITAGKNLYSYSTTETGFRHPFDYTPIVTNVAVTGVTLSSGTLTLTTPATAQLTATVAPTNATNKTVTWTTSNAAVATVSATGLVSSIAAGTATITAKTQDGAKVATCLVTVSASTNPTVSFTTPTTGATFNVGSTLIVNVAAAHSSGISNVQLYLNNVLVRQENQAPYDWGGNDVALTNKAAGTYTLKAIANAKDGKTSSTSITITVANANVAVTGVTLSSGTLALTTPATAQLTATVAPINATNKTVTWTTSNAAVATVSATGLVSSIAAGTATITATTQDGAKVATCLVTVTAAAGLNLKIEAESYASMFGVQTQTTTDTGGGLNVGYLNPKDWMLYNVITIPSAGTYTVTYRIASLAGGGILQLETNAGATILDAAFAIPSTGGWQNWQTVTRTVTFPAGTYNLGLNVIAGGFNINWFTITKNAVAKIANNSINSSEEVIQETNALFYPNPVIDTFNLVKADEGTSALNIFDLLGRLVLNTSIKQGNNTINISNLKSGIYMLQYQIESKVYQSKLIKID